MSKFYQCIQSYGPSFMTKFCSALYLENLFTNIFAKSKFAWRGIMHACSAFIFISVFNEFFLCANSTNGTPRSVRHIWGYPVCLCPTKGTPGVWVTR